MNSARFENEIKDLVPADAVAYCVSLFNENPFHFRLSRNRTTKSGDYRYDRRNKKSMVTVNRGLNKYSFLITLIHEIAHHVTRIRYPRVRRPHGAEWKMEFRRLMLPLISPVVFPDDIIRVLSRHLKNPKASTWSDAALSTLLKRYDDQPMEPDESHLIDLSDGTAFVFNKKAFIRISKRRTRILCEDPATGRNYLIPGQAVVKVKVEMKV